MSSFFLNQAFHKLNITVTEFYAELVPTYNLYAKPQKGMLKSIGKTSLYCKPRRKVRQEVTVFSN